ncbi:hypothetical protein [Actinokineospora sp. NBRC 105648]|uniref:hypothetical protein n=1 Tax=Actinokineospora sp. NBRC 105648 TaxID=3032206 RepID=UPI0024A4492A|nr:hypothetical protein [Actinokineospora sp. NBRC 105648]GLZ40715.1 hypothetical protein Acsp05_43390 [Actinokineospora sp. NBRC 105648]
MDHEPLPVPPSRPARVRRIAAIVAGLVLLGGAIVVLRTPPEDPSQATPRPVPPPQTTVREFAGEGVVTPAPGAKPEPPSKIVTKSSLGTLQLWWGTAVAEVAEPKGAAGYEVRWGHAGTNEYTRLVAQPTTQLDGLENSAPYDIEIRTIDSYGQRSKPAKTTATPQEAEDKTPWSFRDTFTDRVTPDPVNWRFFSTTDCGRATTGGGSDGKRLIVSAQCGAEPVGLRARAPFRLRDAPADGELGRFVVVTDHPSLGGELLVDLVPGPADLIDGSPNGSPKPDRPGLAQDNPALPPGTIRVRVAARDDTTDVQVLVAPGTPRMGTAVATQPVPTAQVGLSVRWEVVLRTDGVQVLRDGVVVGGGDVVPAWREATALVGLLGGGSGLYAGINLIGFVGAPTAVPVLVVPPPVDAGPVVVAADAGLSTTGGTPLPGTRGGQVRLTLIPQNGPKDPADDTFTVEIGGANFPARPAVAGQPMTRGVRYPVVADVPPEALVLGKDGNTLPIRVHGPVRRAQAATRVVSASVELVAPEGAVSPAAGSGTDVPLPRTKPALARPGATLFDAAGKPITEGAKVPSGRVVLEVRTDGPAGQRVGGELAGVAGVEVRLDGQRIAGIPTVADGPGVGGVWRLALTTNGLTGGNHSFEIRLIGTTPTAAFAVSYRPFTV